MKRSRHSDKHDENKKHQHQQKQLRFKSSVKHDEHKKPMTRKRGNKLCTWLHVWNVFSPNKEKTGFLKKPRF